MRPLIINASVRDDIARLRAFAEAHPLRAIDMVTEAERNRSAFDDRMSRYTIDIPVGFRVTFSHEIQPAGLCRHISVSIDRPKKSPSIPAVTMICQEFGMGNIQAMLDGKDLTTIARIWMEDAGAGRKAVNILQLVTGSEAHA